MLNIIGPDGNAVKFPMVCPHCDQTYWYTPGDFVEKYGVKPECWAAVRAQLATGVHDEGRQFWVAMLKDGIKQGAKAAEHA